MIKTKNLERKNIVVVLFSSENFQLMNNLNYMAKIIGKQRKIIFGRINIINNIYYLRLKIKIIIILLIIPVKLGLHFSTKNPKGK